jgi:hypothetical protein
MYGCTDPTAMNYNPLATIDNGSCRYSGCMDPTASNYNPIAVIDDGSCVYGVIPVLTTSGGVTVSSPVYGCTDPTATNYNPLATIDNGSCLTTIIPNLGGTTPTSSTTVQCTRCVSGSPVSNSFPGAVCPPGWQPVSSGNPCKPPTSVGCEDVVLYVSAGYGNNLGSNTAVRYDPIAHQGIAMTGPTLGSSGDIAMWENKIYNITNNSGIDEYEANYATNTYSFVQNIPAPSSIYSVSYEMRDAVTLVSHENEEIMIWDISSGTAVLSSTISIGVKPAGDLVNTSQGFVLAYDSYGSTNPPSAGKGIAHYDFAGNLIDFVENVSVAGMYKTHSTGEIFFDNGYQDSYGGLYQLFYDGVPMSIGPQIHPHPYPPISAVNFQGASSHCVTLSPLPALIPRGFHYMPDGSLMADVDMLYSTANSRQNPTPQISNFDLDLSDLPATSERRRFNISGDKGAKFKLEVKDNTTGYYYNFVTNAFQADASSLEEKISSNSYNGSITFPAVTGPDDQYDVYLYAQPGTEHAAYREKRFGDGSLDINGSTGSSSLVMRKVIYQYAALTLTLQGYSIGNAVPATPGGYGTDTISINRGKTQVKTAFSFTTTAATNAAYRILKQPVADDVLAFIQPVVGSVPIDLPGENIYPAVTTAADATSEGGTTVNGASTGTTVTTHVASATIATVGDRVLGNAALAAAIVTVETVSGGNTFTISEAISIADDLPLSFSNRMNYSWPIDNYANLLKEGMVLVLGTHVTADTSISAYEDTVTLFEGTKKEKTIIKNTRPALNTLAKKPTVVKGLVTAQEGQVVFDKQQALALAGQTLKAGGYGENEILRVYGWEVRFTDLAIALTAPTTTTTEASAGGSSADIEVNSVEGVINNVSRVGGIGINPKLQNPLITAGGGATGTDDWTMDAVQTLENGITLTVENTSRVATITGNIRINKAGNADQTLRFDVGNLLSTSA